MHGFETPAIGSEGMTTPEAGRGVRSVLVVDDNAKFLRLAGGLIRGGIGCRVAYARDGIEALDLLRSFEPSVVVSDFQMPRMNGFDLIQAMRTDHPEIPVILMSAYGSEDEDMARRALKAGAAIYIPKGCLTSELVNTLLRVLTVVDGNEPGR